MRSSATQALRPVGLAERKGVRSFEFKKRTAGETLMGWWLWYKQLWEERLDRLAVYLKRLQSKEIGK